jgi:hypothetical protein
MDASRISFVIVFVLRSSFVTYIQQHLQYITFQEESPLVLPSLTLDFRLFSRHKKNSVQSEG